MVGFLVANHKQICHESGICQDLGKGPSGEPWSSRTTCASWSQMLRRSSHSFPRLAPKGWQLVRALTRQFLHECLIQCESHSRHHSIQFPAIFRLAIPFEQHGPGWPRGGSSRWLRRQHTTSRTLRQATDLQPLSPNSQIWV